MKRVAIVCPGRGSYTEKSLGSLQASHPLVQEAEALRKPTLGWNPYWSWMALPSLSPPGTCGPQTCRL